MTADDARPGELEDGVRRSRGGFMSRLRGLLGGGSVSAETWAEVEESLIAGDVGAALATIVVDRARASRTDEGATAAVRQQLASLLLPRDPAWELAPARRAEANPAVVLIVGVNGTGKTTTIGKLAAREAAAGRRIVLAAADTFRAAASEQLRIWATGPARTSWPTPRVPTPPRWSSMPSTPPSPAAPTLSSSTPQGGSTPGRT